MLVQFRFKNFGSFKDEAVFDMRAIKAYKEHPYNLINENSGDFLKVAAIYGANASGKSNFVEAYARFIDIVAYSFTNNGKERNLSKEKISLLKNYNPFKFDDNCAEGDTEYEAIYRFDNNEYRYGFVFNSECIKQEWLYKRGKNNRQSRIFERNDDKISLGISVKKSCEKYISEIDKDVLALSFFSSLKLKTSVFRDTLFGIISILPISGTDDKRLSYFLEYYFKNELILKEEKNKLLQFLNAIDVGIKDIDVEKNEEDIYVYTYHIGKNGKRYRVDFKIESSGTKRAIAIYSIIRIAIIQNQGLIIDELDAQLHTLLLKYFVDWFSSEETTGQLIYTTHNTTLLDNKYMRRDQIWFVDKNDDGESSLYSLAEFKIRNDQSFEKGYLGGMFGGIPDLKTFFIRGDDFEK